ncbi:MAG: hypothetical protein QXO40_04720 [Candidatus Aenigmatarchaeota archaeon]
MFLYEMVGVIISSYVNIEIKDKNIRFVNSTLEIARRKIFEHASR